MNITIFDQIYNVIDAKEKITITDSFVVPCNKIGSGNGEAKLYIGNEGSFIETFFGKRGFIVNAFFLKKDLLDYMNDVKDEYFTPEQAYRCKEKFPLLWEENIKALSHYDDISYIKIIDQSKLKKPRVYVKSSDKFKILRSISLPNITYLSILKLRLETDNTIHYYIKPFVDYFEAQSHPKVIEVLEENILSNSLPEEEKTQIIKARIGQGKYRKSLLEECPFCPITIVSDDRLLIASHIKPWAHSDEKEKIDPKNGFMFTPTYDFLFDRGFITFTDDKKMNVSPWLSKMTCSRLNLIPDKKYDMLPIEGRTEYLAYHRENIFKK